jgi:hypothetical protein
MNKNTNNDMSAADEDTGTSDCTYALISTCYHLLQGAETLSMFVEDAEEEGDEETVRFLTETREEFTRRADRAKELLAKAL